MIEDTRVRWPVQGHVEKDPDDFSITSSSKQFRSRDFLTNESVNVAV